MELLGMAVVVELDPLKTDLMMPMTVGSFSKASHTRPRTMSSTRAEVTLPEMDGGNRALTAVETSGGRFVEIWAISIG